ncbi:MAG: hypothetical protein GXO43_09900 [Crenarchaeota archaeon]|nr:hypothetical protein [Thermoproteota archaeon]
MDKAKLMNSFTVHVTSRLTMDDLNKLVEIMAVRGTRNRSQVIREAIRIYHGLISGQEKIVVGQTIINNPIVNINHVQPKIATKTEVNIKIDMKELRKLVKELHSLLSELYRLLTKYEQYIPKGIYSELNEKMLPAVSRATKIKSLLEVN